MKFTEKQLREFVKPLSDTEEQACKNAIRMIAESLKQIGFDEEEGLNKKFSDTPSYQIRLTTSTNYKINIFLQGSYENNTNVSRNSDVDIAIVQEDIFRTKYRENVSREHYGFIKAPIRKVSFKTEVENALKKTFKDDVVRRNKSIKINGNSYRKDADAVPSLRFRDYRKDFNFDEDNYIGGILITPDNGEEIINYPEQHMKNGIQKNKETNYYFKKIVRVAKEMRYRMQDAGFGYAADISSFGVECLLWNVPNEVFLEYKDRYTLKFQSIVDFLFMNKHYVYGFKEINDIKLITQDDIEREKVYIGFIEELRKFYDYEI